jgi:hypothetical protein
MCPLSCVSINYRQVACHMLGSLCSNEQLLSQRNQANGCSSPKRPPRWFSRTYATINGGMAAVMSGFRK